MIPRSLGDVSFLLNSSVIRIASNRDAANLKMSAMSERSKEASAVVRRSELIDIGVRVELVMLSS